MRQRIEQVRKRMQHFNLHAFLITSLVNIRYLFGFTGSNAIALIASDLCFLVTDRRYRRQVQTEVQDAEILVAARDLFSELPATLQPKTGFRLGFEAEHLPVKHYTNLTKLFPQIKFIASERIVERIASVKDAGEIQSLRKAASIVCDVWHEVVELLRPGLREVELAVEISYKTKIRSCEREPFAPIVASGPRSAMPHAQASDKKMQAGELVIVDFGAQVNGYVADFTRTCVLGKPTSTQAEMARIVTEALFEAQNAVHAGMIGKDLDFVAREFIEQAGFGDGFQHSLGHGLGLELHALPRIGERSTDVVQAGQVLALEPGIYLPNLGGVRVEDDFVVTAHGVENLTPISRELVCVE
ncbi:MAG: M24 family metallopeptidase [bacterium]